MNIKKRLSPVLRWNSRRAREGGYIAIVVALALPVLFGMAAFSIDMGRWYITGQKEQRAADAAALAGVPSLPGDQTTAFADAQTYASNNGYTNGTAGATVTTAIAGTPTQLRVTITKTVSNVFGKIFRVPTTTITRTAVADYAGPVPMGSPCNEMGDDPDADASTKKSANCGSQGDFWGATGSPGATKHNGDAYQNLQCNTGDDGCTGAPLQNTVDYNPAGHYYAVTLTRAISNLRIEAFDPGFVDVGTNCTWTGAHLTQAAAIPAANAYVSDPATRYAGGIGNYCTGDVPFDRTPVIPVNTKFTMLKMKTGGRTNLWDPNSFQVMSGACAASTFTGFSGDLSVALDKTKPGTDPLVGANFRRWVPLCSVGAAPAGTYLIEVQTNGVGADTGNGQNDFSLRAFSSTDTTAKDAVSIGAYSNMTIFANVPSGTTVFNLARVPSGAAGQVLNVRLFDVGDASGNGSIKVNAPTGSGVTFTNCVGSGAYAGTMANCTVPTTPTAFQGKWENISVPIPSGYVCNDADTTACWVTLSFTYSGGNVFDTTSWAASIEGDPVRLVE